MIFDLVPSLTTFRQYGQVFFRIIARNKKYIDNYLYISFRLIEPRQIVNPPRAFNRILIVPRYTVYRMRNMIREKDGVYDALIVGAGITGASLLYVLTKYANLARIVLLEKYEKPAQINSHYDNNSQTLHFGDIE